MDEITEIATVETVSEAEKKQIAIIDTSIEVLKTAPQILKANQLRTSSAKKIGESILAQWQAAWEIEDEDKRIVALTAADERSNKFLANCSTALKEEKEARAAISQMMDMFRSLFTAAENELDKTKAGTVANKVQSNRDRNAKEIASIRERKKKEAEQAAARAKEAVDIKYDAEKSLNASFNERLLNQKNRFQTGFNNLTLKDFADSAADIRRYQPSFSVERQNELFVQVRSIYYHTKEEAALIVSSVRTALYESFSEKYVAEMTALKNEIVDKLPSKFAELEQQQKLEIEAANAKRLAEEAAKKSRDEEEKKRLQAIADKAEADRKAAIEAQKKREAEDAAKAKADAEEAQKKAEQEAEIKKQGEQTMVMFEQEAALAESAPAPEARQGYEIEILHPVAYTQIFALWFENEGKNLPVNKIGNTKLDQMRTWCEKHAHKTGTKIESKFLKYNESFKAVNRKEK